MVLTLGVGSAWGDIIGDIDRVGYAVTSGPVVRAGAWTPVFVTLTLQNQASFDGLLRLRQFDRDGDVFADTVPVHLSTAGGGQHQYCMYIVANPAASRVHGFQVELLATEDGDEATGEVVKVISGGVPVAAMVPPVESEVLSDDHYLILALSDGPLGSVRQLQDLDRFDRQIHVAHIGPRSLPNKWLGLEMIDCIVWDEADPTVLTEAQEQALVEWVRQGGRLVLAAGRTSDVVAQSEFLGPLLPVKVGPIHSTTNLPQVRARLLDIVDERDTGYKSPIVIAVCQVVDDPAVKHGLYDEELKGTVLATRRVGRGHLVFVSADLKDLLGDTQAQPVQTYMKLLELRLNAVSGDGMLLDYRRLVRYLDREVSFHERGGAWLALALLFSVAYVLLATLGVWKFLQAKNLLKHSWTALALVAALASVASIAGVQAIHGVGRDVRQLCIVDGMAGTVEARATAYFGLTTSMHSRLDVWLPSDYLMDTEPGRTDCTLRPMLDWQDLYAPEKGYTNPSRYWIKPATAEIHDVPVRATLKQFEGRWQGDLRGVLTASLTTERITLETEKAVPETLMAQGSWIHNDLGVDLESCYLLVTDRDRYVPQRLNKVMDQRGVDDTIRALPLGRIKDGERIDVFDRLYRSPTDPTLFLSYDARRSRGLDKIQTQWGSAFAVANENVRGGGEDVVPYRLDHYQNTVLLMTVLSDLNPMAFKYSQYVGVPIFSRSRCRQLDLSHLLTPQMAIFVGFSDGPGPVRLGVRTGDRPYSMAEPEVARTVYRFLVPVATPAGAGSTTKSDS